KSILCNVAFFLKLLSGVLLEMKKISLPLILLFSMAFSDLGDWHYYPVVNRINDIEINDERLWCATDGGVCYYSALDFTLQKTYSTIEGLGGIGAAHVEKDSRGNLWFLHDNMYLSKYDGEWTSFDSFKETDFIYAGDMVYIGGFLFVAGRYMASGKNSGILSVFDITSQQVISNTIINEASSIERVFFSDSAVFLISEDRVFMDTLDLSDEGIQDMRLYGFSFNGVDSVALEGPDSIRSVSVELLDSVNFFRTDGYSLTAVTERVRETGPFSNSFRIGRELYQSHNVESGEDVIDVIYQYSYTVTNNSDSVYTFLDRKYFLDRITNISFTDIKKDPFGNYWVGTNFGLFVFEDGKFPHDLKKEGPGVFSNAVKELETAPNGNVYCTQKFLNSEDAYNQTQLFRLHNNSWSAITAFDYITCMAVSPDNVLYGFFLWGAANPVCLDGVFNCERYGTDTLNMLKMVNEIKFIDDSTMVAAAAGLSDFNVLGGLYKMRAGKGPVSYIESYNTNGYNQVGENGSYDRIENFAVDKKGNYWISYEDAYVNDLGNILQGVFIYDRDSISPGKSINRRYLGRYNDSLDNDISGFLYDSQLKINSIDADRDGNIWISTNNGLFHFYYAEEAEILAANDEKVNADTIPAVYTNIEGVSPEGIWRSYLIKKDKGSAGVFEIDHDARGNVWAATVNSGVVFINGQTKKTESESGFSSSNSPLVSDTVYSLRVEDEAGFLWLGTPQGLFMYETMYEKPEDTLAKAYLPSSVLNSEKEYIEFNDLMVNTDVYIYNLSGQLVYEFNNGDRVRNVKWNGRTKSGRRVGSGVYFYKLTAPNGSEYRIGKIAVIR
ncbi:MAG: two-component regulator propeller domain-containing protein, partial [Fibrobacterota bacterium]